MTGASLVVQWLRVCLPMQGTRVRALVWEDPTCRGATGPVNHNYWACASGACAPQQERARQWEARAPRWRVAPTRRNWRKPSHRNEDPTQTKKKKKKIWVMVLKVIKLIHTLHLSLFPHKEIDKMWVFEIIVFPDKVLQKFFSHICNNFLSEEDQ